MKKILSLIVVLTLAITPLCTGAFAEEDIVLTALFWGDSSDQTIALQKTVEAFNALDNGITINAEWMASEDTKTKLPTLMAANQAPDMFMCWSAGYIKPYVDAGKIYCLDEAMAADPEWVDRYLGGTLEHLTYDGKVYGIPGVLEVQCAAYNNEIMAEYGLEIPQTHSEFLEAMKVIRDGGKYIPVAFGNSTAWPSASHSEVLVNAIAGTEAFQKAVSGEGSWTDPAFIQAAQMLQDMANEKLFPDGYQSITPDEAIAQFKNGRAAAINWNCYFLSFMEQADSAIIDKYTVTKQPTVDGGVGDNNMWLGQPSCCVAIAESCQNKEAAVEFLKYYSSDEAAQRLVDAGVLPAVTTANLDMTNTRGGQRQLLALLQDMTGIYVFYDVVLGSVTGNEYNNTTQAIVSGADATEMFEKFQNFYELNAE